MLRAVLTHLGLWQPKPLERAPPVPPGAWPAHANLPLTYHAVPDIPEIPRRRRARLGPARDFPCPNAAIAGRRAT
jgi:hypothetical protein